MDVLLENNQRYQLGPWIICPQSNTITNTADTFSIDNKSMQVLLLLIQHSGETLTKNQILEIVWKGSFVADDILSVAISKIRKVLGDNARSPTFIKTVPNVGYVLIAEVKKITEVELGSSESSHFSRLHKIAITLLLLASCYVLYILNVNKVSEPHLLNINSIAVLPFDDLSTEQDNQYFTDGLSDAIINQLSQNKLLKVISRYSSFKYREQYNASEIGQALQVDTLLDGSVQKMGERIRINVRIFSAKNGQQLWSKTFDSEKQDSFKLQDNISSAIQEIIQPDNSFSKVNTLVKSAKKINAQAYEWYLMGQFHWRQRNPVALNKAETYFKHSLDLEPDYAEAHIGLGITYAFLHTYGNWSERRAIEMALSHIMKALALEPNSATALAAKGMILSDKAKAGLGNNISSMYQEAEQAFIRSLELDNNATTHHWYSTLLRRLGKDQQAIQQLNQAIGLNPLSAPLKRSLSFLLKSMGKLDSAQRIYQQALMLEPDHFSNALESTHLYRHTHQSIIALAQWHAQNTELFVSCSSDEYCEQLVLAYLSIGANEAANNVLTNMGPKHGHFLDSLDLINFGENGDEQKILLIKERIAFHRPNNKRALFDLAVAQLRAGEYLQAKDSLLQLYPKWRNKALIGLNDISADNYVALMLYAEVLARVDDKEVADYLLHNVVTFLKQNKVFDKIQAEFSLAETNAQLGNSQQALVHLKLALEYGWLETYDSEWWPLKNNHYLQRLHQEPEFKLILEQHQEQLSKLRKAVHQRLYKSPITSLKQVY